MDQTPTRQTSEQQLASWNQAWRTSPLYAQILRSVGIDPSGPIKLSESQAHAIENALRQNGVQLPDGMKIDNAGNLNQTNEAWKRASRVAAVAGAATATALTGGAASPFLTTSLGGAATGGAIGYGATGTARGALTGAAIGAVGGGLNPGPAAAHGSMLPISAGVDGSLPGISGETLGAMQGATMPAFSGASSAVPIAASSADTVRRAIDQATGKVPESVLGQLRHAATDPKNIVALAALLPMLTRGGGGNSPFGDSSMNGLGDEITKGLAMQRQRMEQAQPAYDALVNMSYGMSPTRYRGATAPAGYTPNAAPEGPYKYEGPRFG